MLYFTGDTHGEIGRFYHLEFEEPRDLTAEDYLVVCGDFGFLFYRKGTMGYLQQQEELNRMEQLPYTILWVDGNHENFDLLKTYPTEKWKGGRIHRIRKNVIHLTRGQIYDIDGIRLFAMGGAYSRDKYMRAEGISWWADELPSDREYKEAIQNLREANHCVDVIVSHTAPREIIWRMGHNYDPHDAELTGFFDWILHDVRFRRWYFGHWHIDRAILPRVRAVHFSVHPYRE